MPKRWRFLTTSAADNYNRMLTRLAREEFEWARHEQDAVTVAEAGAIVELQFDEFIDDLAARVQATSIRPGEFALNAAPLRNALDGAPRWSSEFRGHTIYWSWWQQENRFVVLDVVRDQISL